MKRLRSWIAGGAFLAAAALLYAVAPRLAGIALIGPALVVVGIVTFKVL